MIPDGFEKMKGKLYVRVNGEASWREVEEPCRLNEVLELIEEQEKRRYLKQMQAELKAKLEEKKYSDRIRKHADAMLHELKHCRVNHPDDSWPWKSFDFVHQCSVMMEEAGEAVRAANTLRESSKGDLLSLYNELAQTGAMCLRIMEQIEDHALRNNSH